MTKFLPIFLSLLCLSVAPGRCAFNSALWKDRISSNDPAVSKSALDDLKAMTKDEKIQAARILGSVLHRGPDEAERAAQALATLGPDAEPALPDLVYALGYDEPAVAVAVSSAIIPLGGHAVNALDQSLQDPNFFVRRRAVLILGHLGPAAAPAVNTMIELLNDQQYEVQDAAEKAIPRVGPAAIPTLMKAYSEANEGSRRRIVQILGSLGSTASPALMTIAKKDASGYVRLTAIQGLSQLQPFPKEALPVLLGGLADFDEGVRGGAADALASLGTTAQPAAKTLKRMAGEDPDSLVRQKANDALSVILSTETPKK